MGKSTIVWLLACLASNYAFGQYSVNTIADSLKSDVNVVIRSEERSFEVISEEKGILKVSYVATILNENGESFNYLALNYNKLRSIKHIEGTLYDETGKEIEKLRKSEIVDRSAVSGASLYEDDRIKYATIEHKTYPYTVEYSYEYEFNGLLNYPSWYPVHSEKISVEKSSIKIITPENLPLRYKAVNYTSQPIQLKTDGKLHFTWSISNFKGIKAEDYSLGIHTVAPFVEFAPSKFSIEGYSGEMKDWRSFGVFLAKLSEGKSDLDEVTKRELVRLTIDAKSTREKAKIVYEYLQSKTRYVSIQLGIGGYQPFPASYVQKNGYGDCKALSNYTKTLLEAVGIESYYTLVNAGDYAEPILSGFPSNQFNHVILCVPNKQDTIWLECTSQSSPFDYLGGFTADRDVLMLTPEGGKLVRTPKYSHEENKQERRATVALQSSGVASVSFVSKYHTELQDGLSSLLTLGEDDQKKWIYKHLDLSDYDITSYKFNWEKAGMPVFELNADIELRKYASKGGKRLFFVPNLLTRWPFIPDGLRDRKSDVVLRKGFTESDTITFTLPENYRADFIPEPVSITSPFGTYESSIQQEGEQLIYTRKMVRYKGTYPKEQYQELIDFYKAIIKADKAKVVLMDKT